MLVDRGCDVFPLLDNETPQLEETLFEVNSAMSLRSVINAIFFEIKI